MPFAARTGDQTSHSTPLSGVGSPNVWIEGRPAWRAQADQHTCPQFDGPNAHKGGVVTQGSSKVFINGFPAARQGDSIIESSAPNSIVGGSTKVNFGG